MKRVRVFDPPFWRGLERFVSFVLFPALLFRALATASMPLGDASRLVIVAVLFTLAGIALSALAKPLLGLPQPTFAACFQCAFRFNTYIALAAASRLGGSAAIASISLMIGVLVPLVNIAAIAALAQRRGGRRVRRAEGREGGRARGEGGRGGERGARGAPGGGGRARGGAHAARAGRRRWPSLPGVGYAAAVMRRAEGARPPPGPPAPF